ncbi:MAG: hypothetical protein COA41_01990 [Sphingopyxis sp.]|nr:MAG: hypothetical protein COA41_01990 [Sphingopyxis sp.]
MSTTERLFKIAQQSRSENGDAFLRRPDLFVPRTSGQAPDMFSEIKALGRAFEIDAAERISRSGTPDAEAEAISREIAESEKLSFKSAQSAVAVARMIGLLKAGVPSSSGDDWAGDSVVVGPRSANLSNAPHPNGGHPAPSPVWPAKDEDEEDDSEDLPIWKNKWALGGSVAVLAFLFYSAQSPAPQQPAPASAPMPGGGGGQQPGGGQPPGVGPQPPGGGSPGGAGQQTQNMPPLLNNSDGQMPKLRVENTPDGNYGLTFSIMTENGPSPGFLVVPKDWNMSPGFVGFWPSGTPNFQSTPASMGGAPFQFFNNQGSPVRYMVPQWQQDNIGFGNICVSFETAQQGQDVPLRGSKMCVRDGSCELAAGCGLVQ